MSDSRWKGEAYVFSAMSLIWGIKNGDKIQLAMPTTRKYMFHLIFTWMRDSTIVLHVWASVRPEFMASRYIRMLCVVSIFCLCWLLAFSFSLFSYPATLAGKLAHWQQFVNLTVIGSVFVMDQIVHSVCLNVIFWGSEETSLPSGTVETRL